ncbi:MAG TPA: VWA domain-containing protein [Pyrinomonadaceae bacterium]|nr:VWA domain-containing protein [Pyrinomonadaceae bacterium]
MSFFGKFFFKFQISNSKFLFAPLLLFFIPFSNQTAFAQDDDEVITVETSLVLLNATLTDKTGKPIFGLKKNQFKIFEDGKEQEIEVFESEEGSFAAVILMDTSGSMEQRISLARSAAINFLDGLRPDDVAAIYNFDSKVSQVQEFSNSRDITERVFDLKAYGWTVMNDAIFEAAQILAKRPEKRRAIIVLSDGVDTKSRRSADKALRAALDAQATIYTVDMSSIDTGGRERMQNQGILRKLAEKSGGRFVATPGGLELRNAFKNIVEELGTQYTLGYQPTNTAKDGKWRKIELKVSRPEINVRTREGYQAPKKSK